jgi:hypothetical protein
VRSDKLLEHGAHREQGIRAVCLFGMNEQEHIGAEIRRLLASRYSDADGLTKIGALLHAAAAEIAGQRGEWHDSRARMEYFGRAFDEIMLMHLSEEEAVRDSD